MPISFKESIKRKADIFLIFSKTGLTLTDVFRHHPCTVFLWRERWKADFKRNSSRLKWQMPTRLFMVKNVLNLHFQLLHLESGDHGVWRHLEGFSCARVHPPHVEVGCHASSNSVVWRCLLEYSVQRMLMRKYHLVSVATIDKVRVCSSWLIPDIWQFWSGFGYVGRH